MPLLVVELRVWRGAGEAIIVPETVIANQSLDIAGTAGPVGGRARTREDWADVGTDEALRFVDGFVEWTQDNLGDVRVDYSPQSYIGVRRGRRVWAPLWLRADGAHVWLPDPDGSRGDEPSLAFEHFVERLREVGLEPSWQRAYNAGANPIALRLRRDDLTKEPVQALLRATFDILEPGATPFSERGRIASRGAASDAPEAPAADRSQTAT